MANAPGKINQKALTAALRAMSGQAIDIEPNGTPITRYEKLAALIWEGAIGGEKTERDEEGTLRRVIVKPVAWMQQFIFERLEGKAQPAAAEDEGRIKASDRVRELARERINKLTLKHAGVPKGPPKHRPSK